MVTVSDTRTLDTDTSGAAIQTLLQAAGHRVANYEILPDDRDRIATRVRALCTIGAYEAVLVTGGTGLAPRDVTYEAITSLLEKNLDGFGELFRVLSFQEIGPQAILSRAIAGCRGHTLIFAMPGSTPAVRLAMEKLILPILPHAAGLLTPSPR